MSRILIIDGHPDPDPVRFLHALAAAYAEGAAESGHAVEVLTLANLDIPLLRSAAEWEGGTLPPALAEAQAAISRAQHILILYPLWLGALPALLKAFLEQVLRPGFAIRRDHAGLSPGLLKGRSVRVVVTMGMPALIYRWFFGAHSLKSLERNILRFCGLGPIRETLIGGVGGLDAAGRQRWLDRLRALGRAGR